MMVKGAKALEMWCQRAAAGYPGVEVCNMSSSWRDGLAFAAIIHHYRPDLIDFAKLDKKDIKGTCSLAFRVAEDKLGIPSLLDAEDMASCHSPDRLSILTYVSEFYHKFKGMQPRGSPADLKMALASPPVEIIPVKRHDSTDSAGMPLSRTPSSSGVSSGSSGEADSASSSSSSICDSPPPLSKVAEEKESETAEKREPTVNKVTSKAAEQQQPLPEESSKVVLRRRERSLASRRLVKSMYAESTTMCGGATRGGMVDSLLSDSVSSSDSPSSPDIERENPFRDAMLKFAALEKKVKGKEEKERERKMSNRATGTSAQPSQVSTATQTIGVLQKRGQQQGTPRSPFKTVLSSATPASVTPMRHQIPQQPQQPQSMMTRTTTMRQLSYTSSPRPYLSGQINRSLSMGQALNSLTIASPSSNYPHQQEQQQQPLSVAASPSYCSSNQDLMSSSFHGPMSMQSQHYSTPKTSSSSSRPPHRTHHRTPSTAAPVMSMMSPSVYTPSAFFPPPPRPLIWHSSPYNSSSPSLSLQQQQSSSTYYTPELKYPSGSTSVNNGSSRYFTPRTGQTPGGGGEGHYSNPKLMEGQSSLV